MAQHMLHELLTKQLRHMHQAQHPLHVPSTPTNAATRLPPSVAAITYQAKQNKARCECSMIMAMAIELAQQPESTLTFAWVVQRCRTSTCMKLSREIRLSLKGPQGPWMPFNSVGSGIKSKKLAR
jgi:hypothetical protein